MHKQTAPSAGPALFEPRAAKASPPPPRFPKCLGLVPALGPASSAGAAYQLAYGHVLPRPLRKGCLRRCLSAGGRRGPASGHAPGAGHRARRLRQRGGQPRLRRAATVGRPRRQRWRRAGGRGGSDSDGLYERVRCSSVRRASSAGLWRWLVVGRPAPCL